MKSKPSDPDANSQSMKRPEKEGAMTVRPWRGSDGIRGVPVPTEKTSEKWKPPKYDSGCRKKNLDRIEGVQLDHTEELSPVGDTLWELIRRELELEWTNGFWLPRTSLPQEKHDLLFDAADWLLNTPSDPDDSKKGYYLSNNDLRILVGRFRSAINRLREQLAQESWNPWKGGQEQLNPFPDHGELSFQGTPVREQVPRTGTKRNSPITAFIDMQIQEGVTVWQDAWDVLRSHGAQSKGLELIPLGSEGATLKNTTKQTSKGIQPAVEYMKDGGYTAKKISREDFRTLFKRTMKKHRTVGDSPN
tara:strand:+ start:153 stop:1064 length:912 start_codon:yes stop_codon:yes gene_type:complete